MFLKGITIATLSACFAVAFAQQGIGDPTFPHLGNKGYRAEHYDLKLNYAPETSVLKADVTMSGSADQDLSSFQVDFAGFTVTLVRLNGLPVQYSRSGDKLTIKPTKPLPKGSKFRLETLYFGKPDVVQSAALPAGMKSGWIRFAGGAAAICEPELAHTWFPCNDHPLNKATFDVDISTPVGYSAISNGKELRISPTRVHFVMDKPGSTCMALVVVGKFTSFKQAGPNGLSMVNYIPTGEEAIYAKRLAVDAKFMEFLSAKIGAYPYSTYGVLVLPDAVSKVNMLMAGSALETTTLPVFGPQAVADGTLCHEMAHQWMGNCVSVTNWGDDLWWVEGFAQYSEWLQVEMTEGKDAYDKAALAVFGQVASSPHWLKPGHVSAADLFSEHTYIGGALTFYALRRQIGDEKFFQTIHQFIDEHKFSSATTQDLIGVASKVSGQDLKPFFDAWLFGEALPKMPQ